MSDFKTMILGGTFDYEGGKPSSVVEKLSYAIGRPSSARYNFCYYNGGRPSLLNCFTDMSWNHQDLIVWMPNVSNELDKMYPDKKEGSVLICSKLMHEGVRRIDAGSQRHRRC